MALSVYLLVLSIKKLKGSILLQVSVRYSNIRDLMPLCPERLTSNKGRRIRFIGTEIIFFKTGKCLERQ